MVSSWEFYQGPKLGLRTLEALPPLLPCVPASSGHYLLFLFLPLSIQPHIAHYQIFITCLLFFKRRINVLVPWNTLYALFMANLDKRVEKFIYTYVLQIFFQLTNHLPIQPSTNTHLTVIVCTSSHFCSFSESSSLKWNETCKSDYFEVVVRKFSLVQFRGTILWTQNWT